MVERIAQLVAPGGRFIRASPLQGGVSARVTLLEVSVGFERTAKFIVRQHGAADVAANPHVAADEYRLLWALARGGLRAPRPVYVDQTCSLLPTPYIVVDYINGSTEFAPVDVDDYLGKMAAVLAEIHRTDSAQLSFVRRMSRPPSAARANVDCLVHGDYWPGNILWLDGELVGVLDWEDARVGDPLADLANTRLELRWAFGAAAAARFTAAYCAAVPGVDTADLPHWEIAVTERKRSKICGWGLAGDVARQMLAELDAFAAEAKAELDRRSTAEAGEGQG